MSHDDLIGEALRAAAPAPAESLPTLAEPATRAGLLDVAYATLDSPVGTLLLAKTPRGLVRLAYLDGAEEPVLEDLAARISPRVLSAPRELDQFRRELDEYFAGRRTRFEMTLDWRLTHGFTRRVLQATARIPYGSVSSYKLMAGEAGSPRGSRAAGNALGSNPLPIIVPCHRVLQADGRLGGYTGGVERKRLLLSVEGALPVSSETDSEEAT
ncbi:MAG: methylated-DNA-[protein]-cysteine S-methyltransferase [Solirubrobacteraceae bacterium]|nr:methylated-DNA-[protein]-cysteine S-methyltransferase [Solirubrobacteraceae bacterium]